MEPPITHDELRHAHEALDAGIHRHTERAAHPDLKPEAKHRESLRARALSKVKTHLHHTAKPTG